MALNLKGRECLSESVPTTPVKELHDSFYRNKTPGAFVWWVMTKHWLMPSVEGKVNFIIVSFCIFFKKIENVFFFYLKRSIENKATNINVLATQN